MTRPAWSITRLSSRRVGIAGVTIDGNLPYFRHLQHRGRWSPHESASQLALSRISVYYYPVVISRRTMLLSGSALGLGVAIRSANAIGPSSDFRFTRLRLGNWNTRPNALKRLNATIRARTSIKTARHEASVALGEPLHKSPLLYLSGDRSFPAPKKRHIDRLRGHLNAGAMLIIDGADGSSHGGFAKSVEALLKALYGKQGNPMPVPESHVIYKSFYLIDTPFGRVANSPVMYGVLRGNRYAAVINYNDLGGAWERDDFGNPAFPCTPGGEGQRERAHRLGVNLAMYALCQDYKADQVHAEAILRRRRWRPRDGAVSVPSSSPDDSD